MWVIVQGGRVHGGCLEREVAIDLARLAVGGPAYCVPAQVWHVIAAATRPYDLRARQQLVERYPGAVRCGRAIEPVLSSWAEAVR